MDVAHLSNDRAPPTGELSFGVGGGGGGGGALSLRRDLRIPSPMASSESCYMDGSKICDEGRICFFFVG